MLTEVVLGQRRSVRTAVQVDLVVAKGRPHIVDVVRGLSARVEAWVGVQSGEYLAHPLAEDAPHLLVRQAFDVGRLGPRRRFDLRSPLIHGTMSRCAWTAWNSAEAFDHVCVAAPPSSCEEEDRIRRRKRVQGRDDDDVEPDTATRGQIAVLGHLERPAHGLRKADRTWSHRFAAQREALSAFASDGLGVRADAFGAGRTGGPHHQDRHDGHCLTRGGGTSCAILSTARAFDGDGGLGNGRRGPAPPGRAADQSMRPIAIRFRRSMTRSIRSGSRSVRRASCVSRNPRIAHASTARLNPKGSTFVVRAAR